MILLQKQAKTKLDFLFSHFQKVYRANTEKALSIRKGVFNPFNKVIAFRVLFQSAMC